MRTDRSLPLKSTRSPFSAVAYARQYRRPLAVVLVALLLGVSLLAGWYAWSVRSDYLAAKADVADIRGLIGDAEGTRSFDLNDLPQLEAELVDLSTRLHRLDDRVHVPVITTVARNTPFLGDRVRAIEEFLVFGIAITDLARDSVQLSADVHEAFRETGLSGPADPDAATWLTVLRDNHASLEEFLARFDAAMAQRQQLDERYLPGRARGILEGLDPMLRRAAENRNDFASLLGYYPIIESALGAGDGGDGRYLVLLMNSQEIRPSGGFPGTYAVITVRNGRLDSYEFFDIRELDLAYYQKRETPLPAPGPIREYLKQEEMLPRDAGWSPDFPEAARLLLEMHEISGRAPVEGVVAVTDRSVQRLLEIVGPVDVVFAGDALHLDHDNVIDVIESYRQSGDANHKDAVRVIGTALMDRIKASSFDKKKQVLRTVAESANRREVQMYATDPELQAAFGERGWDGSLYPDPETPTLAVTLANIVGNKASKQIDVAYTLDLAPTSAGSLRGELTIRLEHTGDPDGHPWYHGFHRTWVSLYLPTGATLVGSSPSPEPQAITEDPRALGYHIPLRTGEDGTIQVTFDLPGDQQRLLLRRQPGANAIAVTVNGSTGACSLDHMFALSRDHLIDLTGCTVEATK